MGALPKAPCRKCGAAMGNRNGYCDKHQDSAVGWVRRQAGTTTTQRGYGSAWRAKCVQVHARDKQCVKCKANGVISPIQCVDHVKPKALGGTDEFENLQGLCKPCHKDKTAKESAQIKNN